MGPGVAEMASTLMSSGVIGETPLLPSCFPFIIPKSSEQVSLILSCLGMNERIGDPPTFQLPSWEGIAQPAVGGHAPVLVPFLHPRGAHQRFLEFSPPPTDARGVPFSGPAGRPRLCFG